MKEHKKKNLKRSRSRFIKRHPYVSSLIGGLSLATLVYFNNPSFFAPKNEEPVLLRKTVDVNYLDVRNNNDPFFRHQFI